MKILLRLYRAAARPGGDDERSAPSAFRGSARTLGGDDAPSRVIEDPNASVPEPEPRVERILHFWSDGFSVDDGPLFRNDDPRNTDVLQNIRQGRAPLRILNVNPNQEVDVNIQQHEEPYVQPKKKWKPFSGGGQRLGSPTPGVSRTATAPPAAASSSSDNTAKASDDSAKVDVDESQPTVNLQIRLGDGTRLVSRFNTSHTLGDVYSFVSASSPSSRERSWVLMTTFPSKELSDKAAVLGDLTEFKRGGVVVQKWS